ncbi:hypothetical protein WN943_023904 [Citrus x changshan-huyou]
MAEYAISPTEELTRFLQIESQYAIVSKTHRDGTLDQIQARSTAASTDKAKPLTGSVELRTLFYSKSIKHSCIEGDLL